MVSCTLTEYNQMHTAAVFSAVEKLDVPQSPQRLVVAQK